MEHFINILKIVLSWPMVILTLGVLSICKFKNALSAWLKNLSLHGEYKGATFSAQSQSVTEVSGETEKQNIETIKNNLPTEADNNNPELLKEEVKNWRARSYLWEYRYLNYYLVPRTQYTLDYFYDLKKPLSFAYYDAMTIPLIPDPKERAAMIGALISHHLLIDTSGLLTISEKGREYVEWRGKMLKSPTVNR
jgi:hypothetical protein